MVYTAKSKHSKRNALARGFANGLPGGIALGQRTRALDQDEQESRFRQQQAVHHARLVERRIAQEEAQSGALGEAAGELMSEPRGPKMMASKAGRDMSMLSIAPTITALANKEHEETVQRVKSIAARLPDEHKIPFVKAALEKHQKKIDDAENDRIDKEATTLLSDGSAFTTQPDGVMAENEEINKQIENIVKSRERGVPWRAREMQVEGLKRSLFADETRLKNKGSHGDLVRAGRETAKALRPQGPMTIEDVEGTQMQEATFTMLEKMSDLWYDKVKANPKLDEWFNKTLFLATQGMTEVGGKSVPFSQAKMAQQVEQSKVRIAELEAKIKERELADAPQKLANDTTRADATKINADANLIDSQRPRGPAAGTAPSKPMADDDLYLRARKAAIEELTDPMSGEKPDAGAVSKRTREIMREARGEGEEQTGSVPQTSEQTAAGNAGLLTRARAMDPEANKELAEKAKAAGWTKEETKTFRDTGKAPAGKPPIQ